jgi:hypothetical protein
MAEVDGFWGEGYFAGGYWGEGYWGEYSVAAAPPSEGDVWVTERRRIPASFLKLIRDWLEGKSYIA